MTQKADIVDTDLEPLREWATSVQRNYIDAVREHGSVSKAAAALGVNRRSLQRSLASLRAAAARRGFSPAHDMTHAVPAPFVVKGVSTLYDGDGAVRAQWVKTKQDSSLAEAALREFVDSLVEDVRGKAPLVKPPAHANEDLLAVYPMGDPHFGMYAWADEAGEDFDLKIAEDLTCAAIDRLVGSAPPAKTAVILELGDFFHTDNSSNQTMRSGNALDVDTRWARVLQVGLRAMVYCIKRTLEKHEKVVVRIVKGNHDDHSSLALALALDAYFSSNPRVKVDLSPAEFWYFQFGRVLIGSTHGDKAKPGQLPGVMATDRPVEWGAAKYRYWYRGHVHHDSVQEFPGVTCESFRTLAARDAWHAGMGYRAGRDMRCIVHHREFGEIERHRCDIAMLQAAAEPERKAAKKATKGRA
jgi:hypothetical protein